MKKILFVCLGNICRSSAAEGIFIEKAKEKGVEHLFEVDSAGLISTHQGELPDERMRAHAAKRGYQLVHRSRPVKASDFDDFDLILAMDESVMARLKEKAPTLEDAAKIKRMTDYCNSFPDADHVPDPYYGGAEGFEYVLDLLEDGCTELLEETLIIAK